MADDQNHVITAGEILRMQHVRDQLEAMEGIREIALTFPGLDAWRWANALVPLTDRLLRELAAIESGTYAVFLGEDDPVPSEIERHGSPGERWLEDGILADYGPAARKLEPSNFLTIPEIRYPEKPPLVHEATAKPICPRCGRSDIHYREARLDPNHFECSAVCCGFKWQPKRKR